MLKLFRKIRRRLLAESKISKYLVYALGEILLVMIGILLALQVNNWNEKRKANVLTRSNLLSLKKDIDLDLSQIRINEDFLNTVEQGGIEVSDFLNNRKSAIDTMELSRYFLQLQLFKEFSPTKTAYDNLMNSGGVNLLKSEDLPRLLASYHFEEPFDKRAKDQRSRLTNDYDPFRIKYIPSGMLRDYLEETLYDGTKFKAKKYQIDWEGLREDEEYRHLLDQILAMRIPARWRLETARSSVNELMAEIDNEVNNALD